jgi:hypothetical protein
MTAPITAAMVREKFPHPVSMDDRKAGVPGCYCVGGAFLAIVHESSNRGIPDIAFPEPEPIGDALRRVNPSLSGGRADRFAWDIIHTNDARDFDGAWRILDEALSYGREATS